MQNILEIKNLRKKFGDFGVENVSFSLPKGYIMGFVGKNGAGKTTTIKAILNMLHRDSGEIKIFGKDNLEHEADVKRKIGVVMDSPFFEENWTLIQTGKALKPFYPDWSDAKYNQMLNKFQLSPTKKIKELSRGMKMKIQIACALAHDPDFLILDEPTGGLDAVARDELMDELKEFITNENKSILFSTHITSDLEKIADYITFIDNGRIIHSDTKDNLLEKYVVVKGGLGTLSDSLKSTIIGYTETRVNFEGIIEKSKLSSLGSGVVAEPATMDELVVYFNKGGDRLTR
ncbi:MAG: ABC transporter ATP-binding protein [Firmicutes bacterium]|nr:ABC transporter ATP-binding protein [Bacillota bacterium]